jgi:hypothetical protein
MSQSLPTNFATLNAFANKTIDYAFVIAGWPTVYTVVKDSYALSGTPFSQFTNVRAWADVPAAVGAAMKSRPEEGGLTIGELEIDVQDRFEAVSAASPPWSHARPISEGRLDPPGPRPNSPPTSARQRRPR